LTTSHRVQAIDSVKGVSIIGVLFIHMGFSRRFDPATLADIQTLQHLFAWCVLAFFFASGCLHGNSTHAAPRWIDFVKKRARRLLVPCLLFSWGYKLALLAAKSAGTPHDLVLMDIQMPQLDGIETTKRIREREAGQPGRRTAILALTANTLAEDRYACFEAGMDGFLIKPLDREKLADALAGLAASRHLAA